MIDEDFLETHDQARAKQVAAAVEYAKLYVDAFVTSPSGAKLLADWDERLLHRRVPVNAPHTEYAAVEAVRQFVHDIHQQIRLASERG